MRSWHVIAAILGYECTQLLLLQARQVTALSFQTHIILSLIKVIAIDTSYQFAPWTNAPVDLACVDLAAC